MKGLKLLLVLPLLIGCAMDATSESNEDVDDSYDYPAQSQWRDRGPDIPLCRPYYHEITFNGKTIVIYEPALCPLGPSLDDIVTDPVDERINPFDELTNPIDESIDPIDEHIVAPGKELIQ